MRNVPLLNMKKSEKSGGTYSGGAMSGGVSAYSGGASAYSGGARSGGCPASNFFFVK